MANKLEGIIFDLDGVIVDTEYHHCLSLEKFIKKYNPNVTWEELTEVVGASSTHFFSLLKELVQVEDSLPVIEQQLHHYVADQGEQLDYPSIFRADIFLILNYAKERGIPVGVASSSARPVIDDVLRSCEIADYFTAVISGKDLPESKPNPDIYFKIAAELQANPAKCVVVEDSAYGIRAGKRAGMSVIAYKETRLVLDQSEADQVGRNMTEIFEIIRELNEDKGV